MGQTGRQMRARTKGAISSRPRTSRTSVAPARGARLRYAFDRSMSRGTPALVAWLAVVTLLLITLFAVITSAFNLRQGQGDGFFHDSSSRCCMRSTQAPLLATPVTGGTC